MAILEAALGGMSLLSSIIGGGAQKKAAKAQTAMYNRALDLQEKQYNDTTARYAPYYSAGTNALQAYMYELGLGARPTTGGQPLSIETVPGAVSGGKPISASDAAFMRSNGMTVPTGGTQGPATYRTSDGRSFSTMQEAQAWANQNPTGGTAYKGYQETPGYKFQVDQGVKAVEGSAAARGGLFSGASMKGIGQYIQGLANTTYDNYLNRLAGVTDMGASAAGGMASSGQAYANASGTLLGASGRAQAEGAIGAGNAITGGISDIAGLLGYFYGNKTNPLSSYSASYNR